MHRHSPAAELASAKMKASVSLAVLPNASKPPGRRTKETDNGVASTEPALPRWTQDRSPLVTSEE